MTFHDAAQAVIDDYVVNGYKKLVRSRRPRRPLKPYFGADRLAGITTARINAYIASRLKEGIRRARNVPTEDDARETERRLVRVGDVSNAEINRELTILKRVFSLAILGGRLAMRPHIQMLREDNVR